jgi:hypothetical protein
MKGFTLILLAIAMAVTFSSFTGCGGKPSVQATRSAVKKTVPKEKPSFRIEKVDTERRMVVVAFPLLGAREALKDSVFQVYAATFVFADSAWNFEETASSYKVATENHCPYVYGYITLPRPKHLSITDWYTVRVWAKTDAGTRLAVWPDGPYSQKDESGKWGYEFVVNMTSGEKYPAPSRN